MYSLRITYTGINYTYLYSIPQNVPMMSIWTHMSAFIIKIMDVPVIYLINTYVQVFLYLYTAIYILGLYNSSFHNLVIPLLLPYNKSQITTIDRLVTLLEW